jgi:hypothetical protein
MMKTAEKKEVETLVFAPVADGYVCFFCRVYHVPPKGFDG